MKATLAINGALALLPVLVFLAVLAQSDTFKLIRARLIILLIIAGVSAAFVAHEAGGALMQRLDLDAAAFARFGGPLLEEALKAFIVVIIIRLHRVGFPLDAAIAGFAIGTGFALLENYYFLQVIGQNQPAVWVVRGFGTAIMHGGATATFAVVALLLTPRKGRANPARFLPGFTAAVALHAAYNQFLDYPVASAIVAMIGFAAALGFILSRDRKSIEQVLAADFEAHCKLHHEILWGGYGDRELGELLRSMHIRFNPAELARITQYVLLHTQLIIYTEALLRARERGGIVRIDETAVEKLEQFRSVEGAIGRTIRLALSQHFHFSRHEFFKLHLLSREAELHGPLPTPIDRSMLGLNEMVD